MSIAFQELILIISASYVGAVGYGEVYRCQVEQVTAGTLGENTINITVMASDKDKNEFFQSHLSPAKIEISFIMVGEGERYPLALISGFVDNDKIAWEIQHMREFKGSTGTGK